MTWLESVLRPACRVVIRNAIGNKAFGLEEVNETQIRGA